MSALRNSSGGDDLLVLNSFRGIPVVTPATFVPRAP
jgi:hypothetical protein